MDAIIYGSLMGVVVGVMFAVGNSSVQFNADHRAVMTYYDAIRAIRNMKDAIIGAERRLNVNDKVFFLDGDKGGGETYWMVPRSVLMPVIDIDDKFNGAPLTSELLNKEAAEANARKQAALVTKQ